MIFPGAVQKMEKTAYLGLRPPGRVCSAAKGQPWVDGRCPAQRWGVLELVAVGKTLEGQWIFVCGEPACCTSPELVRLPQWCSCWLAVRGTTHSSCISEAHSRKSMFCSIRRFFPSSCMGSIWRCVSCKVARTSTDSLRC